jgi:hypothetical protein
VAGLVVAFRIYDADPSTTLTDGGWIPWMTDARRRT